MKLKPLTLPTLKDLNKNLLQTLGLAKEINRNRVKPNQVRVESHLEEELKRRKLTTNEPG
jgi:hypothetical protein